jgi:3-oxoacyl-ACP reductase-like protein
MIFTGWNMAKYVRRNRREKLELAQQKKEAEALKFISEPVTPKISEPTPIVQKTINPTFAEIFEKKFEAISRAVRQSLVTAQKVHAHIDQLPEEQYREKLHRESSDVTNNIIANLLSELDTLSKTIPTEATALRKAVENYREPFIDLISPSLDPEKIHSPKPTFS